MRKMLKKVPSADWMCEDCKFGQSAPPKRVAKRAAESEPPPPKRLSRDPSFNHTSRLQTRNATLLKSNSFNASNPKPKLKLVDEVLPQKPKEIPRTLQKSMSLKSAPDSKVKMLSPRISHILDSKGSRSLKERHFDRKTFSLNSSTPKSEPTPRPESTVASFSSNTRDAKSKATAKLPNTAGMCVSVCR